MRGLEPGSFHKMNTSALKWRAEKGRLHGGPQHLMNSAICRLFLDSEKFLEMSFPGWFLLHKSLCFSPWQPHNSRAQLSSDSTNRTPQNTHFNARVFPPLAQLSSKNPAWDGFKTEWSHWPWMKTHAGINQGTYVTFCGRYAQENLTSLRCWMSSGFTREPEPWQVQYSRTGSSWVLLTRGSLAWSNSRFRTNTPDRALHKSLSLSWWAKLEGRRRFVALM